MWLMQKIPCHPWRQHMPCCIWRESSIQWTVGKMNGSLSFPVVSAEESLAHLWANKLSTGHDIFVLIVGVAPGQPPEFLINLLLTLQRETKKPRLLLWGSLSWVMDDCSVGLCVMRVGQSRPDLIWPYTSHLSLASCSMPCIRSCEVTSITRINMLKLFALWLRQFSDRSASSLSSTRSCTISRS